MNSQWFDVDRVGLGRQAEQHSKGRLIGELVQNALDEVGVTTINITLASVPGRPLADLTVADDSPEGFKDLSHAYTLFANSYKRDNPEQRGQYNFGEKLVLAVCDGASISTTTGTVVFDPTEGRIEKPRQSGVELDRVLLIAPESFAIEKDAAPRHGAERDGCDALLFQVVAVLPHTTHALVYDGMTALVEDPGVHTVKRDGDRGSRIVGQNVAGDGMANLHRGAAIGNASKVQNAKIHVFLRCYAAALGSS